MSFNFEDFQQNNGSPFWWGSELEKILLFESSQVFRKTIDKAIKACMSSNIEWTTEFVNVLREDGTTDWKISRFGCFMLVMSVDSEREVINQAKVYLASMVRMAEVQTSSSDMDRLAIRHDIVEGNKALSGVVNKAGIQDFARFQNAGYRGMYNMLNVDLAKKRGVSKDKLLEYMGRPELSANLFRVTMTEERIRAQRLFGQDQLERAHSEVSKEVRKMVKDNTGKFPEELPLDRQLPEVKKQLKAASRHLKKHDTPGSKLNSGKSSNTKPKQSSADAEEE
ncbi:MAG: damage-inducible protein [bacterium]|nr:damage-inducible protein [bacterium]